MAKYSYNELKSAATAGRRIGGWKGKNVYACSKYDYDETKSHFYVLYDDGNKLISQGKVYGEINSNGEVTECSNPYFWYGPSKKKNSDKAITTTTVTKTVPATTTVVESGVNVDDFFARIDREINELLAATASQQFDMGEWII